MPTLYASFLPSLTNRLWYFDTSTLRAYGKKLLRLHIVNHGYTSSLAIIELLSGINKSPTEFHIRKAVLNSLTSSNFFIDLEMYDDKQRNGFSSLVKTKISDTRVDCLKLLVDMLVHSKSFDDFLVMESRTNLEYGYSYFNAFDNDACQKWIQASLDGFQELKSAYEKPSTKQFCRLLGLPPNSTRQEIRRQFLHHPLNIALTIFALSEQFCEELDIFDPQQYAKVYNSYNNKIDPYVRAFSLASTTSMFGQPSNRNDGIDALHFLYIHPTSRLLSEDPKQCSLASQIGIPSLSLTAT